MKKKTEKAGKSIGPFLRDTGGNSFLFTNTYSKFTRLQRDTQEVLFRNTVF